MKTVQRLHRVGYDTTTLQSTDLRLWSDRRPVLRFLLQKLCGDDELMFEVLEVASKDFQFDDERRRAAKAFYQVFWTFQLDHLTLENLLGETPDCNMFVDSVLDLIEIMQPEAEAVDEALNAKKKIEPPPTTTGLEGFMSNFALLDGAALRIKDLTKEEIEIFPANLKQEAMQFRQTMNSNLEQCFIETLSQIESIKRQFQRRHISPVEANGILIKYTTSQDHLASLQQLEQELELFIKKAQSFIQEIPNCIEIKEKQLQGTGKYAKTAISAYYELLHLTEMLKNTGTTLQDLQINASFDQWSNLQVLFQDIESQLATIKPRINRVG